MFRPAHRDEPDTDDAGRAKQVWEQPCEAVEPFVERLDEELLVAPDFPAADLFLVPDEVTDDVVVALAELHLFANFRAHVIGLAADALGQRLVRASAACASDFITQF